MDEPTEINIALKKRMTKREKALLWCLIGVVVLALAGAGYIYRGNIKSFLNGNETATVPSSSTDTAATISETTTTSGSTTTVTPITDAGVTYTTPVKLADLKLIKDTQYTGVEYYQIGTFSDGRKIITAYLPAIDPGGDSFLRFVKNTKNQYSLLTKASLNLPTESITDLVISTVIPDTTTVLLQLNGPDSIIADNGAVLIKGFGNGWFSDLGTATNSNVSTPAKVADSSYGPIYKALNSSSGTTAIRKFYLKYPDGTYSLYGTQIGFLADDSVPLVTLDSGAKITDKFKSEVTISCAGTTSVSILNGSDIADQLLAIGKTNTGDTIYTFANTTNDYIKDLYASYSTDQTSQKKTPLSIDAYLAKTPFIIWKDQFGDYDVFGDETYLPQGECGKPVVYLYPTKTEAVSVKVGATITKSDPAYENGWNAVAEPSGKLTIGGKVYPNLFWEGTGDGIYPTIDSGFVVKQADLAATIKSQLAQMGLNSQESADFLAFWLPKMPATPYVRLTWFGTAQMNRLAPLNISSAPDTLIRVFLDFAGLENPIVLPPEKLSAPTRKGFTVVEWGGLLRSE